MKKYYCLGLLLLLYTIKVNAQQFVSYDWSINTETDISDVEAKGDFVYTAGTFAGSVIRNGNTYTANGAHDILIQKFDSLGNLIWVCQVGGNYNDACNHIYIDDSSNVYVTGWTTLLSNIGDRQILTAKINQNGQLMWSHQTGSASNDEGLHVTADYLGNVYVAGNVEDDITFAGVTSTLKHGVVLSYTSSGQENWIKACDHGKIISVEYSRTDSTLVCNSDLILLANSTSFIYVHYGDSNYHQTHIGEAFICKQKLNGDIVWLKIGYSSNASFTSTIEMVPLTVNSLGRICFQTLIPTTIGLSEYFYATMMDSSFANALGVLHVSSSYPHSFNPRVVSNNENFMSGVFTFDGSVTLNVNSNYQSGLTNLGSTYPVLVRGDMITNFVKQNYLPINYSSNDQQYVCRTETGTYINQKKYLHKICDHNCLLSLFKGIADTSVCQGKVLDSAVYGHITFTGGVPPFSYQWKTMSGAYFSNFLNPSFTIDSTISYILTITDSLNLQIIDTVTFTSLPNPIDSITVLGNNHICLGSNDSLLLKTNNQPFKNSWYKGLAYNPFSSYNLLAIDQDSIFIRPSFTDNYALKTSDYNTGCFVTNYFYTPYYPTSFQGIADQGLVLYPFKDSICEFVDTLYMKTKFLYNPTNPSSLSFNWYRNGIFLTQLPNYAAHILVWEQGTYVLEVTDGICSVYDTLEVYPKIAIANLSTTFLSNPFCPNVPVVLKASGANSYLWQPGNLTNDSIIVSANITTTYTVTGIGCISSDIDTINVVRYAPDFFPSIQASSDIICLGDTCILEVHDTAWVNGSMTQVIGNTHLWSPSSILNSTTSSMVVATPISKKNTEFKVISTDSFGCSKTTSKNIFVIDCCVEPKIDFITYLGGDSIRIFWDSIKNASSYSLRYKRTSSSTWVSIPNIQAFSITLHNLQSLEVYEFQISSNCPSLNSDYSPSFLFKIGDSVYINLSNPDNHAFSIYPNPTIGNLIIGYEVNEDDQVNIVIYDMTGRKIQHLLNEYQYQGYYKLQVDLKSLNLAGGVYLIRMKTSTQDVKRKLMYENR